MWQDNLSWKERLFYNIPYKRGQSIKPGEPRAFFTRVNNSGDDDWPNLRLEGIQGPDSPPYSWIETILGPEYYIVAIDTRVRTIKTEVDVQSKDHIPGEIQLSINHQVIDLKALLGFEDPLEFLTERVSEAVRLVCTKMDFQTITEQIVNQAATSVDLRKMMGLNILRTTSAIRWPAEIVETLGELTTKRITEHTRNEANNLKIEKLKEFGITDKFLMTVVLGKEDADFGRIIEYVQAASQASNDQYNRELELLKWMAENDYLSGPDLAKVKDGLVDRLNRQADRPPVLTLPFTTEAIKRLEEGERSTEEAGTIEVDVKESKPQKPDRPKKSKRK